jgi:peptidoglycan/LPS O-acetylase OafA/YrhL
MARPSLGTSWLDGLRGVAALQVFFFHFFGRYIKWSRSFGSSPEDRYIHQLPIFRSIWGAGSSAVSVFFLISGYAITVKSLHLLRQRQYDDLYKGLSSSLIRRGFRLYLPLILLSIPMLCLIRTVDMVRDGYAYDSEVKDSWHMQFVHLVNATDDHINPFMYPDTNPSHNRYAYLPPSWTIPLEYQGSIAIYLLVMVVSRIELFQTRFVILAGMALYSLHRGAWWISNFVGGMILADYELEQASKRNRPTAKDHRVFGSMYNVCCFITFCVGFYLGGMPPDFDLYDFDPKPKPGYEIFYQLYPPHFMFRMKDPVRWYWYWSGTFTVVSISQLPWMRLILDTKLCQWLGKLSFSLYLVHAAVIGALSTPLQAAISNVTEHKGVLCLFEFSIITPLVFILSGVVERYIDQPSVRLAKKVEQYLWQELPEQDVEIYDHASDVSL